MATETALDGWNSAARIGGNTRANLTFAWTFTILWNIVSAPILVYIPPEVHKNSLAAIGFLFPIVGVGLLAWSVLTTLRWRRFGQAWFELTVKPATPGGELAGAIHVRLSPPTGADPITVVVKLTCLQRTVRRGAEHNETRENILWREEEEVSSERIAFSGGDAAIPVRFAIPADALETTVVSKSSPGILWVLSAEAQIPGVNLKEDFDVPVVKSAGVAGALQPGVASAHIGPASHVVTLESLARSGITVQPADAGTTYHFGAMRNLSFATGFTVFMIIWTGALWLQWRLGFPWIFPIITGLFEILLVLIALDLWFGALTVTISSGTIHRGHTIFGVGVSREIPARDIAHIVLSITMQTSGRAGTPYYEIQARRANGRKVSLGSGIRDKRQAEWLAAEMRTAIGLREAQK